MPLLTPAGDDPLEPDYRLPYQQWKQKPTPANTGAMLRLLKNDINTGIRLHVGKANPLIRSRARRLAYQALQSYDPQKKVRLGTHVVNQLQGLRRINRQQTQILKIPERVSIEQNRVRLAEQELTDSLGRDPSLPELSDATGLSGKRLLYLRQFRQGFAEGQIAGEGEDDQDGLMQAVQTEEEQDPWLELVYGDLDPVNQKIMEWTVGMHGQPVRANQDIARALGVTPGAISQRKMRIQQLIDMGAKRSPF